MILYRLSILMFLFFNMSIMALDKSEDSVVTSHLLKQFQSELRETAFPYLISHILASGKRFSDIYYFGKSLEASLKKPNSEGNIDKITIHSDRYWAAFFAMPVRDSSILLARIYLLVLKGHPERALDTLPLARLHSGENPGERRIFKFLQSRLDAIQKKGVFRGDQKKNGMGPVSKKEGRAESGSISDGYNDDPSKLNRLVQRYFKDGEDEFAIYILYVQLTDQLEKNIPFDRKLPEDIAACLKRLGAAKAGRALKEKIKKESESGGESNG